jgi:hypothetical protein
MNSTAAVHAAFAWLDGLTTSALIPGSSTHAGSAGARLRVVSSSTSFGEARRGAFGAKAAAPIVVA